MSKDVERRQGVDDGAFWFSAMKTTPSVPVNQGFKMASDSGRGIPQNTGLNPRCVDVVHKSAVNTPSPLTIAVYRFHSTASWYQHY